MSRWVYVAVASLLVPCLASAEVVFKSDFESGNPLSEWDDHEMVSSDRLSAVQAPVRQGRYALRALVVQGDDPIDASGNRNELLQYTDEPSGSEYWYKWSTMFDADFPAPDTWQLFLQWHHRSYNGSPPLEFTVEDGFIELVIQSEVIWRTPLVRSIWHDFVFHVKWSSNEDQGFVELWHNGELVLPKTPAATQFPGLTNYLKIGLYRDDSIQPDGIVWHDDFVMATAREDVFPVTPLPEPEPQPDPEPNPDPDPTPEPTPAPDPDEPGTTPSPAPTNPPTSPWGSTPPITPSGCGGDKGGLGGFFAMIVAGLMRLLGKS